ncbi:MAG: Ni/Fe-hydrogenase cytochrome b subunit [Ignavibacteria bacterium]|jgi:Ni/Fe-hydrogenase subunit HybB-like protein
MLKKFPFKITFWNSVGFVIIAFGVYSAILRYTRGLGAVTNLSDTFPWGLWIGFDILCGVGLAAGAFTICAVTHIFHIEKFKPLTRPTILTAFLGYAFVALALMFDLGKWYNIWHPLIMWNPASVMFEVAWCVMLYLTVLFLEFLSFALQKFNWVKTLNIIRKAIVPIYILGIILSTLHQSSLGSLYLIVPFKMYPLWYTSFLPYYFYISAISVGFVMIIFESYLSARAFGHGLNINLLSRVAKIAYVFLIITVLAKFIDLTLENKLGYLFLNLPETYFFWGEIFIGFIIPIALLSRREVRESRFWLYITSIFVIAGFLFNRLNVSITSLMRSSGVEYFPSIYEIGITMMLVTVGIWLFSLLSNYFPVFEHEEEVHRELNEEYKSEGLIAH